MLILKLFIRLIAVVTMGPAAVFWTLVLGLCAVEAGIMGDQCDWTGRYGNTFLLSYDKHYLHTRPWSKTTLISIFIKTTYLEYDE